MAGVGPSVPLVGPSRVPARLRARPSAPGLAPVRAPALPLVVLPVRVGAPAAHNARPRLLSPLAAAALAAAVTLLLFLAAATACAARCRLLLCAEAARCRRRCFATDAICSCCLPLLLCSAC